MIVAFHKRQKAKKPKKKRTNFLPSAMTMKEYMVVTFHKRQKAKKTKKEMNLSAFSDDHEMKRQKAKKPKKKRTNFLPSAMTMNIHGRNFPQKAKGQKTKKETTEQKRAKKGTKYRKETGKTRKKAKNDKKWKMQESLQTAIAVRKLCIYKRSPANIIYICIYVQLYCI